MTSIASIFSRRPEGWGYRGDPFLWDALGWELSSRVAQIDRNSPKLLSFEPLLTEAFRFLISGGERNGDGMVLNWLPAGGMSSRTIHLENWNDKLLPELSRRFQEAEKAASHTLEYHPAEHRFRFAAWAASTAARSSRQVCTFPVSKGAKLLRLSGLKWLSLGSHWLPVAREDFDSAHHQWCKEVLQLAQSEISKSFTYGIAAKLVNCYLKALFLQTMVGTPFHPYDEPGEEVWDASTRFIHPPIDRVLMKEAARRSDPEMKAKWRRLISVGWSNFNSDDYLCAIRLSREMVGEDVAQIEACWSGFQ